MGAVNIDRRPFVGHGVPSRDDLCLLRKGEDWPEGKGERIMSAGNIVTQFDATYPYSILFLICWISSKVSGQGKWPHLQQFSSKLQNLPECSHLKNLKNAFNTNFLPRAFNTKF
jgi:hypothetical protein